MVLNKYGVALLQFVYVVIIAFQTFRTMEQNASTVWQLVGVVVGAAFTVGLPLTQGRWAAALKVLSALVAAAITAIIPLALGQWNIDTILVVVMAVVNAAVVQFGVDARIDGVKAAITNSYKDNHSVYTLDPAAYSIAVKDPTVQEHDTQPLL